MRIVTFSEIVPGMVLCPVEADNPHPDINDAIIISKRIDEGEDPFWDNKRALHYIDYRDSYMGICASSWRTSDVELWAVIDDQPTLDKIRAKVKAELNKNRDHINECERLIDANL